MIHVQINININKFSGKQYRSSLIKKELLFSDSTQYIFQDVLSNANINSGTT